jgi:flagellar export protein FliJ
VAPTTRLDPVVKSREREEEEARTRLAEAIRRTAAAREQLIDARLRAAADVRAAGLAAIWSVLDDSHARAMREVKRCAAEVDRAAAEEERLRAVYIAAHRAAEAVRRVRDSRLAELRDELAKRERKELDELGALGFAYRR